MSCEIVQKRIVFPVVSFVHNYYILVNSNSNLKVTHLFLSSIYLLFSLEIDYLLLTWYTKMHCFYYYIKYTLPK